MVNYNAFFRERGTPATFIQLEILDTEKIMKYALFVKLWQHNFTIVIVVKLQINDLCWEKFNEKCKIFKN